MKRNAFIVASGIVLIGGMSAFLLVQRDPEYMYATSDDGVVTVSGMARETQSLTVAVTPVAASSVLADRAYVIGSEGVVLDAPIQVTFRAGEGQTAYALRSDVLAWEPIPDVTALDGIITFSTARMGIYALGTTETVTTPDYVAVYEGLRDVRPDDAIGYTIQVSYARPDEQAILLSGIGEQGGCGGAVLPGASEAQSATSRAANVLVNDVQTAVTFYFRAVWHLADGGCPELSPFRSANEHGILPSSP